MSLSRMKLVRTARELTQRDLAEATGIPSCRISAVESRRMVLSVERREALARELEVEHDFLFNSDGLALPADKKMLKL